MAGLLKLDSEKFNNSIGALKAASNDQIVESMTRVAQTLKNTGDSNPLVEQALEACKKFQNQYNVTLAGIDGFIKETRKMYDIAEHMEKRANVGEVSSRDTAFDNQQIDSSSVLI